MWMFICHCSNIFDALATYKATNLGLIEANPILRCGFRKLGISKTLVIAKGCVGSIAIFGIYYYNQIWLIQIRTFFYTICAFLNLIGCFLYTNYGGKNK